VSVVHQEKSSESSKSLVDFSAEEHYDDAPSCCFKTIEFHALNNKMMVCDQCKQIIKCFTDEKSFRNYVRFCRSRNRKILICKHANYLIVIFRSYDA